MKNLHELEKKVEGEIKNLMYIRYYQDYSTLIDCLSEIHKNYGSREVDRLIDHYGLYELKGKIGKR